MCQLFEISLSFKTYYADAKLFYVTTKHRIKWDTNTNLCHAVVGSQESGQHNIQLREMDGCNMQWWCMCFYWFRIQK